MPCFTRPAVDRSRHHAGPQREAPGCVRLADFSANRFGHLLRADGGRVVAVGLHVVGDVFAFGDHRGDAAFQSFGRLLFAQVLEHQLRRENQGRRIDLVLPFVLGGAAVRRLEDRPFGADVRAGSDAQSADQARTQIAQNIAVQVRT